MRGKRTVGALDCRIEYVRCMIAVAEIPVVAVPLMIRFRSW